MVRQPRRQRLIIAGVVDRESITDGRSFNGEQDDVAKRSNTEFKPRRSGVVKEVSRLVTSWELFQLLLKYVVRAWTYRCAEC